MDVNEVIREMVAYKDGMMRKQVENARRKRVKTAAGVASLLKPLPAMFGNGWV